MGRVLKVVSTLFVFAITSALTAPVSASTDPLGLTYEFKASSYDASNGQWVNTSGANDAIVASSVATGSGFPTKGSSPDSVDFNGATNGFQFITTQKFSSPQTFSLEVWFRTTGAGKIIGFEGSTDPTENSTYDRHLYVGSDGRLYFGIFGAGAQVVNTNSIVNSGVWHHAVGTFTAQTSSLYLDGRLIQTMSAGAAENTTGFWRLGGNRLDGWINGSDGYFNGSIGEARIYPRALTALEISGSYAERRETYPSTRPAPPKPTIVNGVAYQPINASLKSKSGLEVKVSDIQLIEKVGSTQLLLTYSQTNRTTKTKLDEGAFKLFFTDGTSLPQYGLFGALFPSDSTSRSYTFEWAKGKKPWLIEWEAGFFASKPTSSGLKWKVGPDYPAIPAKKYKNCVELNKVYAGGVARSAKWSNKGSSLKQKPTVNAIVYDLNKGLDRDRDLLVCER